MKLLMTAAALALALPLGGCLMVSADVKGDIDDFPHDLPRLLGAEVGAREPTVSIVVSSNGCTEKSQFAPVISRDGDHEARVGFRRIEEDRCRAFMAEGKRLTWTFDELGISGATRVTISNRIGR